jgi:amino acid transporter
MLATCMFMSYVVLLGFSTPNAMVLGKYVLLALGIKENTWNARFLAVYSVTGICWLHATHPKLGLRLVNLLSAVNMIIFAIVIVSGVAGGLMQVGIDREVLMPWMEAPFSSMSPRSTAQRNFDNIWADTSAQPYDFATALLKVIYCFRGYNTVNQVLSDVKNPVRTLKIAAPIALSLVSVTYLLLNIAFFLVVDKDEFHNAGETVAAIFFQKVFGSTVGTHVLPLFVVFSAAGSITATSYAQARVNETLAKDGLLPWSSFWTTKPPPILLTEVNAESRPSYSKPSAPAPSTPSKGLLLHWLVSTLAIVCPPPGPIYNFLVNLGGYPVSIISVAVSTGLLYLQTSSSEQWTSPVRAPRWMVVIFAVFNCLLCIIPLLRPGDGHKDEDGFAWFAYPVTGLGILGLGAVWWVWWSWFGKGAEPKTKSNEEEETLLRVQEDDEVSLEMDEYAENGEESVLVH